MRLAMVIRYKSFWAKKKKKTGELLPFLFSSSLRFAFASFPCLSLLQLVSISSLFLLLPFSFLIHFILTCSCFPCRLLSFWLASLLFRSLLPCLVVFGLCETLFLPHNTFSLFIRDISFVFISVLKLR